MKRRNVILTVVFFVGAIFFLSVFTLITHNAAADARRLTRYEGEYAFEELCAAASELSVAMSKCTLVTTPGLQATLCAEAYAQSLSALTALGQLPFASEELERTADFLSRAGDYAHCLVRTTAAGVPLGETDRAHLAKLAELSAWVTRSLEELRGSIAEGLTQSSQLEEALVRLERELPALDKFSYDGCYSPASGEAAMLVGSAEISERDACLIAAAFLGQRSKTASSAGQTACDTPCWRISLGDYAVAVSVRGGQVLQAVSARVPGEAVLSVEEAREKTEKFLASRGYSSMTETGSTLENNCLITSWCARQGDVLCYPDAVTVAVALDTGELAGFDATAYVNSHRTREPAPASLSWDDARDALAEGLEVEREYLSVIASPGGEEKLCMTFLCRREDGSRCLIFCSAATGAQERVTLLREDERGLRSL